MNILGVRIDNLGKEEILERVFHFLDEDRFHQIATVNPEFILKAQKDEKFKDILNSCDLNVADGSGISFAFWWLRNKLKARMTGIDLMQEILKVANNKKLKIYLVANKDGLSSFEETKEAILKKYPTLEVDGVNLDKNNTEYNIPDTKYQILICNFGAPYQEKFLNSVKCDKIRLAVGVGGSFDYLTSKAKRAPKWMQFFGIEWLWRLLLQPKRFGRIWNAVIIFPIKIIFSK